MVPSEQALPDDILARATLRGKEYAWRIDDIPAVIEAARRLNLINIGGQLQFRIPNDGICECYWVEVDTFKEIDEVAPWAERVTQAADAAQRQFAQLRNQYDFMEVGKSSFSEPLNRLEESGGSTADAMCFVWYVTANEGSNPCRGQPQNE